MSILSEHFNVLHYLPWDTDFLGMGVARLPARHLSRPALQVLLAQAKTENIRLIYLIADPADTSSQAAALAAGAVLVDRKATLGMSVAATEAHAAVPPAIGAAGSSLTPELERLALQSGEYSRFRLDPRLPPATFPHLYREWLRNSLSGELAREVLIYQPESHPGEAPAGTVGLLTLGVKQGRADIGLLAVDAVARGLGVGQQLVAAARQRTASWGFPELQVVTQLDNEPACAFYQKCGFAIWQVDFIYHLWLE